MLTYLTTSTAPALPVAFTDQQGNAVNITGASFAMTFRSVTTLQKVGGSGGSWTTVNAAGGLASYALGASDMANAYALASTVIGDALFEYYGKATISGVEYDALPTVIKIRRI